MGNKRKIIFSILKEIEKGEIEPKAEHYGISNAEFGDIVDMMEYEKLIKGSGVARGGSGNEARVVFLKGAKITLKGLEYLEENNAWTKSKLRGVKALPLAKVPGTARLLSKLANEIKKDLTGMNTCGVLFMLPW